MIIYWLKKKWKLVKIDQITSFFQLKSVQNQSQNVVPNLQVLNSNIQVEYMHKISKIISVRNI